MCELLNSCEYPYPCTCSACKLPSYKDWPTTGFLKGTQWESEAIFKAMHPEQYKTKPKRGPIPSFPKLKLFTFTVKDEHIPSLELKQRVVHTMSSVYAPEYYIAAIEYGETNGRIHCHVLASFREFSFHDKDLTYSKFNSRFKERYERVYKLGHIDVKPVDLKSNPSSVKDICVYFSKECRDNEFFSNEEAEKIYKSMLKEHHALQAKSLSS